MRIHREALQLRTSSQFDVIDVTSEVVKAVVNSQIEEGYALIYSRHTTFAILLNEKESGLLFDTCQLLQTLVPECQGYRHDDFDIRTENMHPNEPRNAHAHLRQILAGHNSEYIPVAGGSLALGTWQRVMVVEFDCARDRELLIQVCGIGRWREGRSAEEPAADAVRDGGSAGGEVTLKPPPAGVPLVVLALAGEGNLNGRPRAQDLARDGPAEVPRPSAEHDEVIPVGEEDR